MMKNIAMLMVLGLSSCYADNNFENKINENPDGIAKTTLLKKFTLKVDDSILSCDKNFLSNCYFPDKKALNIVFDSNETYFGFRKFIVLLDKIPLCKIGNEVTEEFVLEKTKQQVNKDTKQVEDITTEKTEQRISTCYKDKDKKDLYIEIYKSISTPSALISNDVSAINLKRGEATSL